MFNIYTGCLYDKRIVESRDFYKIAICTRLYPHYPDLHWWPKLAPRETLFVRFHELGWEEYLACYEYQLRGCYDAGGMNKCVEELKQISQYTNVALLCYEKSSEPCHRHTLAEFLNKRYDLNIREF